jgi:hypothetical protein
LSAEEKLVAARKFIEESVIKAVREPGLRVFIAFRTSQHLLPGYSTLDTAHREDIENLIGNIRAYAKDNTRKRPLNCLMLAAPGSGKSYFIKLLAAKMKPERVEAVIFNMATMQDYGDMSRPIDELRNFKVDDRLPLLFLDEFDTDPSRYAVLLPLLWEGELQVCHRDLKFGKAVIVLAGSSPKLAQVMKSSGKMRPDHRKPATGHGKLVDLLSRINGGTITIPDLDSASGESHRRVDKVCIAISLLRARFAGALNTAPRALLRFIAETRLRYGVRSIAYLIDLIDATALQGNALILRELGLPFSTEGSLRKSSLALHLYDGDKATGIITRWKTFARDECSVRISDTPLDHINFDPITGNPMAYG